MGKTMFSGIGLATIDGAVGNRVFTRNFYGTYVKERIPGPAVISPALASWQGVFSFVHAAYEALTDIERNEWIASARLPDWLRIDAIAQRQKFSGFHLFMHLNLSMALALQPLLTLPPIKPVLPAPPIILALHTETTPVVAIDYSAGGPLGGSIVYATGNLNAGRMSTNQIYTFMFVVPPGGTGVNITPEWTARFGAPVLGKKIFFKIVPFDNVTGVTSAPFQVSSIVV